MIDINKELKFMEEEIYNLLSKIESQVSDKKHREVKTTSDVLVNMITNHTRSVYKNIEDYEVFYNNVIIKLSKVVTLVKINMKEISHTGDLRPYRDMEIVYSKLLVKIRDIDGFITVNIRTKYDWYVSIDYDFESKATYRLSIGVHKEDKNIRVDQFDVFYDEKVNYKLVGGKFKGIVVNSMGSGMKIFDSLMKYHDIRHKLFEYKGTNKSQSNAYLQIKNDYQDNNSIKNNIMLDSIKIDRLPTRKTLHKNEKYTIEEYSKLICLINFYDVYYKQISQKVE